MIAVSLLRISNEDPSSFQDTNNAVLYHCTSIRISLSPGETMEELTFIARGRNSAVMRLNGRNTIDISINSTDSTVTKTRIYTADDDSTNFVYNLTFTDRDPVVVTITSKHDRLSESKSFSEEFSLVQLSIDFILSQYANFSFSEELLRLQTAVAQSDESESQEKSSNTEMYVKSRAVGKTSESVGTAIAGALVSGSTSFAQGITSASRMYTNATMMNRIGQGLDIGHKQVTDDEIAKANERKQQAEIAYRAASVMSNTLMAPVRLLGSKVGQAVSARSEASSTASDDKKSSIIGEKTVNVAKSAAVVGSGVCNALLQVSRGVQESMTIIGSSIGDATMSHSKAIHGNDYAEKITKQYVSAAGKIGRTALHLNYALSFGVFGVAEMMVGESLDQATGRSDFLCGPLLRQGFLLFAMPPIVRQWSLRFVVVRPWSIAIYSTSNDLTRKGGPQWCLSSANISSRPIISREPDLLSSSSNDKLQSQSMPKQYIEVFTIDKSTFMFRPLGDSENELNDWFNEFLHIGERIQSVGENDLGTGQVALLERSRISPKTRTIRVTLFEAKGVIAGDVISGTSDVFASITPLLSSSSSAIGVSVKVKQMEQKSVVISKTRHAIWNPPQVLEFGNKDNDEFSMVDVSHMVVRIRDQDISGYFDPLGIALIPTTRDFEGWVNLEPDERMSPHIKNLGSVLLKLESFRR